jgi:hypothetical protein
MMWRRFSLRSRIFVGGVVGSISLVGLFFALAVSGIGYSHVGNIVGRLILRLFEWLNPLLLLLSWVDAKLHGPTPPEGIRQLVLIAIYLILFFGWWWVVAVGIEWLTARRRAVGGAA